MPLSVTAGDFAVVGEGIQVVGILRIRRMARLIIFLAGTLNGFVYWLGKGANVKCYYVGCFKRYIWRKEKVLR